MSAATSKKKIPLSRITAGISDYNKEATFPDSVAFIRAIDYRSDPRRWRLLPKAQKESGSTIVDLPKWGERVSDNTYVYGDAGNIYKRTLAGVVTLEHTAASSSGNGLKYYGEDDFLYYTSDKVIGRYGQIGGTPSWSDDFLGAQGGVPTNTYSLDLESGSSQYATAPDDASISITGDLTLETWRKPESLPAAGAEMVLHSKWNENSNQRSYKFALAGISGYFGDGTDGALTIAADTTEAPIDSACSGTVNTTSLTATNVSFAANQIILILQVTGTGVGTWQRNKIIGYTAGTITLDNPLNATYTNSGASKAQVRVLKQYSAVTINSAKAYTAKAWDGTVGGILAWLCSGTTTITGTVVASQKGYQGGADNTQAMTSYGYQGYGASGATPTRTGQTANGTGGAGGRAGDGGSGAGGGGHTTAGGNGTGSASTLSAGGDAAADSADLTTMVFGGGGGGAAHESGAGYDGGDGGGIIFIAAVTLTVSGGIASNGQTPSAPVDNNVAGSGGGAGGSILLKAQTATLGTALITATGGTGAANGQGSGVGAGKGGDGSVGRVHLDYLTSYTGTTSPTLNYSQDQSLVTNTTYALKLYISSNGTNSEVYQKNVTTIAAGTYSHLGVSWDASASLATFYEAGNSIGTYTGALTAIYNSTALLGIGADFDGAGAARSFFDGLTDEDRVWGVVRTDTEITNNKETQLSGLDTNLKAYYKHNNALDDDSPNANTLTLVNTPVYSTTVPFAGATTRQDIDKTDASTGQTAATAVAISESATTKQSFIPAKDPQKSIQINISDTGDDPTWTITVHDGQNRVVATKTLAHADVVVGNNEFIFATPWRPIIGATYHFHITTSTTTGAPAVVTGTISDLETAQFTSYYQFLVTDTDYHPIEQIGNKIAIGNDRYVATYDAATYTPHRLTLPSGYRVRCLALWREYLAIGCWRGSAVDDYDQGIIFFWDGISDTYNFYINVPEGAINAMLGSAGKLNIIAGYKGTLLEYTGGDEAVKVKKLPNLDTGKQIEVYPQSMTMWDTLLRIGAGNTDSSTFEQGIYTWGAVNRNYGNSLSYDYRISPGVSQNSNIQIGMLLPVDKKLLIGWKNNTSYGLDVIDPTSTDYGLGSVEFLISDEGGIYKEKKLDLIRADFEPLISGHSVGLQYKLDRASSWTTEETETTAAATKLRVQVANSRHQEYQVRLNISSTVASTPAVLGVTVVEDILEGEELV